MSRILTLEQRLILASIRPDIDGEIKQHLVTPYLDWHAFVRTAEQWRIASLVYTNLWSVGLSDHVPMSVMSHLKNLYRRDMIHSVAQRELLRLVLARFSAEGIAGIVLNEAMLAILVYPTPASRPISDIDLLVHGHERAQAETILQDIQAEHSPIPYLGPRAFDHVKLHASMVDDRLPTQDVWMRATSTQIEAVSSLVLCHEDVLLHLALLLSAAHQGAGTVQIVCDIAATCRHYGDTIDWNALVTGAERYQMAHELATALHLAHDLIGAKVPPATLAALRAHFDHYAFEEQFTAAITQGVSPGQQTQIHGHGRLTVSHDAGLTSCLSVRLHEVSRYRADHGRYPDAVDSSNQFQWYADEEGQHVAALLLAPVSALGDGPHMHFHYGQQFAWYRHLDLQGLQRLARQYCWPTHQVIDAAHPMMQEMHGRTAVLYRGNDKSQEIPRTPYDMMFAMAERSGAQQFWVQTDEADFFDAFTTRFPDTRRIEALPMIRRDDTGSVLPQTGRTAFAITFLAALYAIAHAPQIICTTGNTALWPMIFRGHIRGVWQYANAYPTYVYGDQSAWIMRDEIGETASDRSEEA